MLGIALQLTVQSKLSICNTDCLSRLGKLIIHDEGFKMLDLIVAVNMAVWWSVWETGRR